MARDDWRLLLRTGFGNIFDVGYGWDYEGQVLLARAVNCPPGPEKERAWADVKEFCRKRPRSITKAC